MFGWRCRKFVETAWKAAYNHRKKAYNMPLAIGAVALVKQGKDTIIHASKNEYNTPVSPSAEFLGIDLLDPDDEPQGPIKANGDINWGCPCMGSMISGPCGYAFRQAFSCFHHSKDEEDKPKGAECIDLFRQMSECMSQYPTLFGPGDDGENSEDDPFNPQETSSPSSETLGMQHHPKKN